MKRRPATRPRPGATSEPDVLGGFERGDRVADRSGRLLELAWPQWDHGIVKRDQDKIPPTTWFVREIDLDFGGNQTRSEPFPVSARLPVELIKRAEVGKGDDRGARGGDVDPLLGRPRGGSLL